MNMGSRNASKIAQRFTDRLLEGFSQELDIYVRDVWLPKQTQALQALLAERSTTCKHAYVIECEGHHYPARHSAVLGALADAAIKRRLRKSGAPPKLK